MVAALIFRSTFGENDSHTAVSLGNLGAGYIKEGRYVLAEATLKHAVDVLETLLPGNDVIGPPRARWGRSVLVLKQYPEAKEQLLLARDLLSARSIRRRQSMEVV